MIWVATHIGLNNVRELTRVLYDILLHIPRPTDGDFRAKHQPVASLTGTDQERADDGASST